MTAKPSTSVWKILSTTAAITAVVLVTASALIVFGQDRETLSGLAETSSSHADVLELHKEAIGELRVEDKAIYGRLEKCEMSVDSGFARNQADHEDIKDDIAYIRGRLDDVFKEVKK